MDAIFRQAKSNLRSHKLQAALILVTLTASATLLTVALTTLHAAQGAYDQLFERTHAAHLWLELDPQRVTPQEAASVLASLPGVEATTPLMRTISGTLFLGDARLGGLLFREWSPLPRAVDKDIILEGHAPQSGEQDVIVLDRTVAKAHGIGVGDTVYILTPEGRHPLTVTGLYLSAEFCPYPHCWPQRMYLFSGAYESLGLTAGMEPNPGTLDVGLRLLNPDDPDAVIDQAQMSLPEDSITDWTTAASIRLAADAAVRNWRILLLTFSIVAGLAAIVLIANIIAGAVRSQTRQIGLLKAVGFTARQVAGIYLMETLALSIASAVLGFILGSIVGQTMLRPVLETFGEENSPPALWIMLAVPLAVMLLSAVATAIPLRRAVRLDTVTAIRTGADRSPRRAARIPGGPLPLAHGWANILTHPSSLALTVLGLSIAVLTMVTALTLNATFQTILSDPGAYGFDADIYAYRTHFLNDEETRQLLHAQPGVLAYYVERWDNFQFAGEDRFYRARFREGDLESFSFPIIEGRLFAAPDEVLVGYGLANERHIRIGDTIAINLEGMPLELKVVGTYRENSNLGRMLMMPLGTLRLALPDVQVYSYTLKLNETANPQGVAAGLQVASEDKIELDIAGQGGLPEDILVTQSVMTGLGMLMFVISALAVLSTSWMDIQDRQREIGILKAVGMTPGQLAVSVLAGAAAMSLMGYAIGLPLGIFGVRALIDIVARMTGFGPLHAPLDVLGLVLILPLVSCAALLGASIPARRAAGLSVVELLRYE